VATELLTLSEMGLWEPGKMVANSNNVSARLGGYSARETTFSPNAWHSVDAVLDGIGMPRDQFDRIRPGIRRIYSHGLGRALTRRDSP
jgi:hypothetical protein